MSWFPFLPSKLTTGVIEMLRNGAQGLASLRSGRAVFLIAVSSLGQWFINGLIAYVALKAFHIDVSPCSITTVSIWPSDGLRALRTLNEQSHLH